MELYNDDCMKIMKNMAANSVHTILTDIPYGGVSRENNGLRQMKGSDKGAADIVTFDIDEFVKECDRISTDNIIIFCGIEQVSQVFNYFKNKPKGKGTVRHLIWEKTNPVPSNGKWVYLSGIEDAIWFRKPKGTFNAYCKNTVFRHSIQTKQIHPTEKSHKLLAELIADNTNEGDLIFDPCMGSCSTGLMAAKMNRKFIGCELDKEYYDKALERLKKENLI